MLMEFGESSFKNILFYLSLIGIKFIFSNEIKTKKFSHSMKWLKSPAARKPDLFYDNFLIFVYYLIT